MSNITNRQMVLILFLTLITFTAINIPQTMAKSAGSGGWISIIIVSFLFALAAVIIVSLNSMFYDQMLFDYSKTLTGKAGAYILAVYYLLYFFIINVYLIGQMANLLQADFLPKTPHWVTVLSGLAICGFGAYKGITSVARLIEIYGTVLLVASVLVHILMVCVGEFKQILPLFNPADIGKYASATKDLVFPFLGIEVLLFIPFTKKNGTKTKKNAFLTLLGIGLFYILAFESSIMVLGRKDAVFYNDALIVALRRVEAPFLQVFQRVDFLYLLIGFMGNIAGATIVYTGVVEYACRIFSKAKRPVVAIAVGAAIFLVYMITKNIKAFSEGFIDFIIYPGLAAAIFIPTLLLIIAKVKKNADKNR